MNAVEEFAAKFKSRMEEDKAVKDMQTKLNAVEEQQDDMNILPFPWRQEILEDRIVWRWPVNELCSVLGVLFPSGEYKVTLNLRSGNSYHCELISQWSDTEAMEIGKAMSSAANWIKIWQEHAGALIAKTFFRAQPNG